MTAPYDARYSVLDDFYASVFKEQSVPALVYGVVQSGHVTHCKAFTRHSHGLALPAYHPVL